MDHLFDAEDEYDSCLRCEGKRSWSTLPTHCVGHAMTKEETDRVHYCHFDFRDGEWIDLCPPITASLIAKFGSQGVPMKSCGYEFIRFAPGLHDEVGVWFLTVRRIAGYEEFTYIEDIVLIEDGHMLIRHHPVWGLNPVVFVELLDIGAAKVAGFLTNRQREAATNDRIFGRAPPSDAPRGPFSLKVHEILNPNSPTVSVRVYAAMVTIFTKEEIRQAAQPA